jgi:hypothetical protein
MSKQVRVAGARRRVVAVAPLVIAAGLIAGGCSSSSSGSNTLAGPVWLCRPGQAADPCAYNLAATTVTAGGTLKPAVWPHSAMASKFDCFYVHPTDSLATTANTGLAPTKADAGVAIEQAAPLSQVCDVWAPSYRSQTFPSVQKGLAGDQAVMRSTFTVAYDSVLPAWEWFVDHTGGKPIILAGDSQGSAILIHLISAQLDHQPSVLRRLLVVLLVGGNLQVPAGKAVGATLTKVPLCTGATQTGCAIAFSSYPSQPPADSEFGRPGRGTSLQSGPTSKSPASTRRPSAGAPATSTPTCSPSPRPPASRALHGWPSRFPPRGSPTPTSTPRAASTGAGPPGSRSPASPGPAAPGQS